MTFNRCGFYENGVYNFKMLNVLYSYDKVNLREFLDSIMVMFHLYRRRMCLKMERM